MTTGSFRNLPVTIARKYQQKQYADTLNGGNEELRLTSKGVIVRGTTYLIGDTLVVDICKNFGLPVFGKVDKLKIVSNDVIFECRILETIFNAHYHAHETMYMTNDRCFIKQSNLPYYLPASVVKSSFSGDFICIRCGEIE